MNKHNWHSLGRGGENCVGLFDSKRAGKSDVRIPKGSL